MLKIFEFYMLLETWSFYFWIQKHLQRFSRFLKSKNHFVLRAYFLPMDSVFWKKGKFHDELLWKTKNVVNSHLSFSTFVSQTLSNRFNDFQFCDENQQNCLAIFLVLNKLINTNWYNQNLRVVEPTIIVYLIFSVDPD